MEKDELEEFLPPTLDVLQQIDAGELLTDDDLGMHIDEFLIQDLGGLF